MAKNQEKYYVLKGAAIGFIVGVLLLSCFSPIFLIIPLFLIYIFFITFLILSTIIGAYIAKYRQSKNEKENSEIQIREKTSLESDKQQADKQIKKPVEETYPRIESGDTSITQSLGSYFHPITETVCSLPDRVKSWINSSPS